MAQTLGVLRMGQVSLDGTKVKANASKYKALSYVHASKLEQQLRAEVAQLLEKAAQADRENGSDGMDLPEELRRRQERLAAIERFKTESAVPRSAMLGKSKSTTRSSPNGAARRRRAARRPRGVNPSPRNPGPRQATR